MRDAQRIEAPISDKHHAAVIAIEREGALEVYAQAIEAGSLAAFEAPLPADDDLRLTLLLYENRLETIGLDPGPLPREDRGRALPAADLQLESTPLPGQEATWTEVQRLSPALSTFRTAVGPTGCHTFTSTSVPLGSSSARFGASIPGGGVVFGSGDGVLRRFAGPGQRGIVYSAAPPVFSALLDPRDARVVWFGSAGGEIWRGVFSTDTTSIAFARTSTMATISKVIELDGDPQNDLFALDEGGGVHHFDGTAWRLQAQITSFGPPTGLTRIAGGVAFSSWRYSLCLFRHQASTGRSEMFDVPANTLPRNGITALSHETGYGTVVGTWIGEIFEARNAIGDWKKIEGTQMSPAVTSIVVAGDRFFYSDARGSVIEHAPGFGFCEQLPLETSQDRASVLVRAGEDLVVAGDSVTWWTRISDR